jgi:endonuclease/exonuclease/phosphatase family metal-dependent hydrolase
MKRILAVIIFFSSFFIVTGCGVSPAARQKKDGKEPDVFIVAQWNVQALFDGQETGKEYREYLAAAGWTAEKYAARITAISQAIIQTAVPALIGFVEVENAGVIEDLANGDLSKHGYFWTAFANVPGASLGIGILSRFPLSDIRAHSITMGKETAPRPVLEVRVEPEGKPLVFLLCHWKSKLGGEDATGALRRSSARVIRRRLRELREAEAETPVIVMGDLNENHDDFFRRSGEILCALLPDDPDAALLATHGSPPGTPAEAGGRGSPLDFLVISGEKPPRSLSFPANIHALYSPWEGEMTDGSYYYKGGWETIDHFLLSDGLFDGAGWDFAGCRVLNHAPFTGADGAPNTYVPRSGRGLSDHLPLLLYLQYRPED